MTIYKLKLNKILTHIEEYDVLIGVSRNYGNRSYFLAIYLH